MSDKVQKIIKKQEETIKELKAKKAEEAKKINVERKKKRLIDLGLYEEDYYKGNGEPNGYPHYDFEKKASYRIVPLDVSDEDLNAIEANDKKISQYQKDINQLKRLGTDVRPEKNKSTFTTSALFTVALLMWAAGAIVGIMAFSIDEVGQGLVYMFSGFASGILFLALAEIIHLLMKIADK